MKKIDKLKKLIKRMKKKHLFYEEFIKIIEKLSFEKGIFEEELIEEFGDDFKHYKNLQKNNKNEENKFLYHIEENNKNKYFNTIEAEKLLLDYKKLEDSKKSSKISVFWIILALIMSSIGSLLQLVEPTIGLGKVDPIAYSSLFLFYGSAIAILIIGLCLYAIINQYFLK